MIVVEAYKTSSRSRVVAVWAAVFLRGGAMVLSNGREACDLQDHTKLGFCFTSFGGVLARFHADFTLILHPKRFWGPTTGIGEVALVSLRESKVSVKIPK